MNFGFFRPRAFVDVQYSCFSMAMLNKSEALNHGGKVILPQTALFTLTQLQIDYPMLFEVVNTVNGLRTHCGVQEFTAEEGRCYMPFWMMQSLGLDEGSMITVSSASLPAGDFVKLQPYRTEFVELTNPRAVLENQLRGFSTLTKGETIAIHYNNKVYHIRVVEIKPDTAKGAISIVETNLQVDFAEPLDLKEVEAARAAKKVAATPPSSPAPAAVTAVADSADSTTVVVPSKFHGTGRSLNGKEGVYTPPPSPAASAVSAKEPKKQAGDLVFGRRKSKQVDQSPSAAVSQDLKTLGRRRRKRAEEAAKEKKAADASFKAFQGTGHSLKD